MTTEIENFFPSEGFEYCNCPVLDSAVTNIYSIFEACFAFIDKIRFSGRRLLVHCHAGVSRSTTICVAYLMRTEGLKYEQAMKWVTKCRPVVAPNLGFLSQLMDYENISSVEQCYETTALHKFSLRFRPFRFALKSANQFPPG